MSHGHVHFRAEALFGSPVPAVASLLLAIRPGAVDGTNARLFQSDEPAHIVGGPQTFTLTSPRERGTISVTPNSIQYTGGWWYRATYELHHAGRGTQVVLMITDASSSARWMVWLANRGFAGFGVRTEASFRRAMTEAAATLDCPLTFPPY